MGRHKLFVSFGVSVTFLWLPAGEEFRTIRPVGYSASTAILMPLNVMLFCG